MPSASKNLRPRRQASCPKHDHRVALGRQAECRVKVALEAQGWIILDQNFRVKHSEIDLIAEKGSTLIFVEVKYRSRLSQNQRMDTLISRRKASALRYGAHAYLTRTDPRPGLTYRYDLAVMDGTGHITYYVGFME